MNWRRVLYRAGGLTGSLAAIAAAFFAGVNSFYCGWVATTLASARDSTKYARWSDIWGFGFVFLMAVAIGLLIWTFRHWRQA